MASAQRLAAKKSGVGRFLPHGHNWFGEDVILPSSADRSRTRREPFQSATSMGIYTTSGRVDYEHIEWQVTTMRPERAKRAPTAPLPMPAELVEAIAELDDVADYADEIEVETPSTAAFDNARRLLKAMYRISPRQYSVYPMPDGYIAIDARGRKGRIAVVMCGSDGGVLCLVTSDGNHRRARYSAAHNLPDGFIREALDEL